MVLSAKRRNIQIIKELQEDNRVLGGIQGDLENAAKGLGLNNAYAKHLLRDASEIRMIIKQNDNMIALLTGEDIALEKQREILEADAKRYHLDALKSLAEA